MTDNCSPSGTIPEDGNYTEVVVTDKSKRVGHLLFCAKCVLIYLSVWQLVLIVCNLFLITTSAFRKRHFLVVHERSFYWFYFLLTAALIAWFMCSITMVKRRDLSLITMLGLFTLCLILIDAIFLCLLLVELVLTQGFNGYLLQILAHSETMHHWLLSGSRIICLTLWICFLGGQLSHTKWTHWQSSRKVNLNTTDFNQLLTEIES